MSGTAVVTVVHGRHEHLALQERSLAAEGPSGPDAPEAPDLHRVVVAMGDDAVADHVAPTTRVVSLPADPRRLPVAAARNLGVRTALADGAEAVVLLDVDCLVAPGAVAAYAEAVAAEPDDAVFCGPVTYLRPEHRPYDVHRLHELDDPHPARPAPGPGERLVDDRWELFWSLSFAVGRGAWERTGGFDEAYEGYGAEDTDLGERARAAGCRLVWLGDARGYHQWHPVSRPPVEHLDDVVRNGRTFRDRWGWWPMHGWLEEFEQRGLVVRDVHADGRTDWAVAR